MPEGRILREIAPESPPPATILVTNSRDLGESRGHAGGSRALAVQPVGTVGRW